MSSNLSTPSFQLMTSAMVEVFDFKNKRIQARILLDTCASTNFVTANLVKKLQLPKIKCHIMVNALNNLTTTVNSMVSITFKSIYNEYKRSLKFLIVSNITDLVPGETIPRDQIKIPKNIKLADPDFHKPAQVDMLIGAGTTLSLFSIGSINLSQGEHDFYLQTTRLGWIFGGGLDLFKTENGVKYNCMMTDLKETIEKFWSVEEISDKKSFSSEELECEAHFTRHVTRDANGRYVV